MFGLFKKKKDDKLIQDSTSINHTSLQDDLSDSDDVNDEIIDYTERDHNIVEDINETVEEDEYERTSREFVRRNEKQVKDSSYRTDMKKVSKKTLVGTLRKGWTDKYLGFKDYVKDVLNDSESESNKNFIQTSTSTENEGNYKGLKKSSIVIALGGFFLLVGIGLIFFNNDSGKPKRMPVSTNGVRNTTSNSAESQANPVLLDIPQTYSDVAKSKTDDKKKEETEKKTVASSAKKKTTSKKKDEVAPPTPSVPEMPSNEKASRVQVRKDPAYEAKQEALSSDISFKISNNGF